MKRFLLIAAMCAVVLSCKQEATLTVSTDVPSIVFGPEGGTFNTILFTNAPVWTATCDDPAITFSPDSGAFSTPIHVEVGENDEHFTKAIRIAVKATLDGSQRQLNIVVTQTCRPFVLCDDDVRIIGPEQTQLFFTINSDKGWRVLRTLLDDQEVILSSIPGGEMDPMSCKDPNNVEVKVQIPENETGKSRKWEILLASEAVPREEACTLTIFQNP